MKALQALGYEVSPIKQMAYAAGHMAVADGEATFMANHWDPLHADFYARAGGDERLYRAGVYIASCRQGYLIDQRIATAFRVRSIARLRDPTIARLFDVDGDGKADLVGCSPDWACAKVIERHLDTYELRDTVTHHQGSYSAMMADTIERYEQLRPILYYAWTPFWVSSVLVPGKDVPPASLGDGATSDDGLNSGFPVNVQRIVANREWAANPCRSEVMQLGSNAVNAQNLVMHGGKDGLADIARHADAWIRANRGTFDMWLEQARAAAAE